MEKTLVQLPLFQEDSRANPSPLQEKEEEQTMIATSGMKLLELLPSAKPRWFIGENVDGIVNIQDGMVLRQVQDDLEKEGFQVQCLVIPASGIGAWHQRKRVWIIGYSKHNGSSSSKIKGRNSETSTGSQKRENTPFQSERTSRSADNGNVSNSNSSLRTREGEQSKRVERTKSGGFITRRVNKPHMTYGAKLSDAMLYLENKKMYPTPVTKDNCTESLETWEKRAEKHKEQGKKIPKALRIQVQEEAKSMYPTPTTNDYKNTSFPKSQRNRDSIVGNLMQEKNPPKAGGRLNPNFVEFLMGYPMNWTKEEPTESKHSETQSCHKSQNKSSGVL